MVGWWIFRLEWPLFRGHFSFRGCTFCWVPPKKFQVVSLHSGSRWKAKDKMQHFNVEADAITGSLTATACLTFVKKYSNKHQPKLPGSLWVKIKYFGPEFVNKTNKTHICVFGTYLVNLLHLQVNVFSRLVTLNTKKSQLYVEKFLVWSPSGKWSMLSNGSLLA